MSGKAPVLTTAGEIDLYYQQTCAQLGQAYLRRLSVASQLKTLDADIDTLREAAHQHLAAYRAAQQALTSPDRDMDRPMKVSRD